MDHVHLTPFEKFTQFADHIAPAVIVFVDFILNRVPFKRKSLLIIIPLVIFYGVINVTVSLIRGQPVYPPLDPHKLMSYVIAASLPVGMAIAFLVWE
jgi:hypothetical protein